MGLRVRSWVVGSLALVAVAILLRPAPASGASDLPKDLQAKLKRYNTRYYVVYSDLDVDTVREAAARLTAMALEYHARTKGFSGSVRRRLPFYLFGNQEDYLKAGAPAGSAGVFMGNRLMALASKDRGAGVWSTVQHEGFHQFAYFCITRRLPIWVNEGLAEYFGASVWTGDGFVAGVIPPGRLQALRNYIRTGKILPFLDMLQMDHKTWNAALSARNYVQAWSMVHFLVHADEGKYRKAFSGFINDVARRKPWENAFIQRFGRNTKAFQDRYAEWWTAQPDHPTADLYVEAVVQTLTSYLARAHAQGQTFKDGDAFFAAARDGKLKQAKDQWLPPTLLEGALAKAETLKTWSLQEQNKRPVLVLARPDGTTFTGGFLVASGRVRKVQVEVTRPPAPPTQPAEDKAP